MNHIKYYMTSRETEKYWSKKFVDSEFEIRETF